MKHVHSLQRFHRDLKSFNLLVSASDHIKVHFRSQIELIFIVFLLTIMKVADFGTGSMFGQRSRSTARPVSGLVSRHSSAGSGMHAAMLDSEDLSEGSARTNHTTYIGTLAWMAPEILLGEAYGPAVDLYSYAIVMWEIAAQKLPWFDMSDRQYTSSNMTKVVASGRRPAVDSQWPAPYRDLMQRCWHGEPHCRGSFGTAVDELSIAKWDQD